MDAFQAKCTVTVLAVKVGMLLIDGAIALVTTYSIFQGAGTVVHSMN